MKRLLFVYNAKSDYWSKKIDFAHKIISPSTYACSLCALTHGNFGETDVWKSFRESSEFKMEFLYKNDFKTAYEVTVKNYPVVFEKSLKTNELSLFLDHEQLSEFKTVEALILAIKSKT